MVVLSSALAYFKGDAVGFSTKDFTVMFSSEIFLNAVRAAQHKPLISSPDENLSGAFSLY